MGNVREWDPKSPNTASSTPTPPTPPVVNSVAPTSGPSGEQVTFSVNGTGFTANSRVSVDGVPIQTAFVSTTVVRGTTTFTTPGVKQVTVDGVGPVAYTVT